MQGRLFVVGAHPADEEPVGAVGAALITPIC